METINEQLKSHFYNHPNVSQLLEENKKVIPIGGSYRDELLAKLNMI
jgi:hypothetical protein